ncbi:hypothetical protein P9112_005834 [Eukaryota sp. TZLM1-RC]
MTPTNFKNPWKRKASHQPSPAKKPCITSAAFDVEEQTDTDLTVDTTKTLPDEWEKEKAKLNLSEKQLDFSGYVMRKNRLVTRITSRSMCIIEQTSEGVFFVTHSDSFDMKSFFDGKWIMNSSNRRRTKNVAMVDRSSLPQ